MKFGSPIQIAKGIFQIRAIGARVTLLARDGEALLVDTGLKGSSGAIESALDEIDLSLDQIRRVVLTHYHPDHSGGLSELVAGRKMRVAVHRAEADIIAGGEPLPNPMQNKLLAKVTQPVMETLMGDPVPVDDRLDDGDVIPFATEVRVVHLPGHTAGSIALYLPSEKIIIVGDALQYKLAHKLSPPAPNVTQRPYEAMKSLAKLLKLNFDTICFSHYPPLREGSYAALRVLIEQRRYPLPSLGGG